MDRTVQETLREILGKTWGVHFHTQLPWGTLKAICQLADGALGNDSGPIHLAQAVGCYSIVLFGPGDHVSYAPFLGRMLRGKLACQPCQSFSSLCPDNQCMKAISVDSVWNVITEIGLHERKRRSESALHGPCTLPSGVS